MAVISIVGTSGVGKSFLVKQLSSLTQNPAFFEGEEGTIPQDIFESLFKSENPIPRWEFFIKKYKNNLEKAHKISKIGMEVFVDGGNLISKAVLSLEKEKYKPRLLKLIKSIEHLEADKIILLKASKEKIKEFVNNRNRNIENTNKSLVFNRSFQIQDELIKLAKNNPNILVIDRTNLDFSKEKDLQEILNKIKNHKAILI